MALRRQVIHVPGVERSHSPIPEGARIGDLVFSSLLAPGDASSHEGEGTVPAAMALFERIANLLRAAGGSADHLADLAVYVLDDEDRPSINAAWVKMFPNPDRPSRRILNVAPKGVREPFAANFTAIVPDPSLGPADFGRLVYSPLISGRLPGAGALLQDPEQQATAMFDNLKVWVEGGGGTLESIGNVMIYTMDDAYREIVNRPWARMFPDRENLPARETINVLPRGLPEEMFACVATAVL